MTRRAWLPLLLVGLLAAPAAADEFHYQGHPVGARAAGMAGAFAGLAEDNSAIWYNPAGLVLGRGLELSLSTSVYGISRDAIAGSAAVQSPSFVAYPSTFALVKTPFWIKGVDENPRHRYGIAILVTDYAKSARQDLDPGVQERLVKVADMTTQFGAAYAYRPFSRLMFGASGYIVMRDLTRFEERAEAAGSGDFGLSRRDLRGSHIGLQLTAGALYRRSERFSAGLVLRSPTMSLTGSLELTEFSKLPGGSLSDRASQSGTFTSKLPLSATVGVAWRPLARLLVTTDVTAYAPVPSYVTVQTEALAETVEKSAVVNVAVGLESRLSAHVPLRLGFFTDFSARPADGSTDLGVIQPDYYGITGSIGYEASRAAIIAGTAVQLGDLSAGGYHLERLEVRWWIAGSYRL